MKLIILNGPSGIGKSTVAKRLHADMPDSTLIDVDELRRSIPDYKTHRQESSMLSYQKAGVLIEESFKAKKSVILDKTISYSDTIDSFVAIAKKFDVKVYEFILFADKEILQKRADERGYLPGSLLTRNRVGELWEKSDALRKERKNAIVIDTGQMTVDELYKYIESELKS